MTGKPYHDQDSAKGRRYSWPAPGPPWRTENHDWWSAIGEVTDDLIIREARYIAPSGLSKGMVPSLKDSCIMTNVVEERLSVERDGRLLGDKEG